MSQTGSHRVVEHWMDQEVETLADLLRPGLRAVSIGINPSPVSVAAGHYYQGRLGQRFWQRLRKVGLLQQHTGFEDDAAFARGLGFTDIIKKPTPSERELSAADFDHGRELLRDKLEHYQPGLVIFTFKKTAKELFGRFDGYGFVGLPVAGIESYVMPGPYERADRAGEVLDELREHLAKS